MPLATAPLLDLLLKGGAEDDEARIPGAPDPVMRAAAKVRMAEAKGRRPSVELMFHSLLPERFVLHTHAIVPNAVTCNLDGEALMRELFGDDALWVPYTDPGLPLARKHPRAARGARGAHRRPAPQHHLHGRPRHHRLGGHHRRDRRAQRARHGHRPRRARASRRDRRRQRPRRGPHRRRRGPRRRAGQGHRAHACAPCSRPRAARSSWSPTTAAPGAADYLESEDGAQGRQGRAHDARPDRLLGLLPAALRPARRRGRSRTSRRCSRQPSRPTSRPTAPRPSSPSCPAWASSRPATPGRRSTPPATSTSTACASTRAPTRSAACAP